MNSLEAAGRPVADPARVFCVMDHIVDTRPGRDDRTLMPGGQAFITETRAAKLLQGRHVAQGVKAVCVPGSMSVKRAAEAEGLDQIFTQAGFEWRESGCSMCFYAGGESFPAGSRVICSTNRNFEGRQGPNIRTHIASPEVVAASAIAGCIADPRELA